MKSIRLIETIVILENNEFNVEHSFCSKEMLFIFFLNQYLCVYIC